jgi:regulatory protein
MAVRFLPEREPPGRVPERDRGDLAEVIDLRSRLPRAGGGEERAPEPAASGATVRPRALTAAAASLDEAEPESVAAPGRAAAPEEAGPEEPADPDGPGRSANEEGVRLLARKALSSGELRRELLALGHDAAETETVIDEFVAGLYLDDTGLARLLTEGLRERKRASRSQIRAKLRERLLPDAAIDAALAELDDDDEYELLRETAQDRARRLGGLDRQTAERRLLGYLARRGWSGERAVRACREALDGAGGSGRSGVRFR